MEIYKVVNDYEAVDISRHTMRKKNREKDVWTIESCDKGKKIRVLPAKPKKDPKGTPDG